MKEEKQSNEDKNQLEEKTVYRIFLGFIIVGIVYVLLNALYQTNLTGSYERLKVSIVYIFAAIIFLIVKWIFMNRGRFHKERVFVIFELLGLILLNVGLVFLHDMYWVYMILVFSIFATSMIKGARTSIFYTVYAFIINCSTYGLQLLFSNEINEPVTIIMEISKLTLVYSLLALFALMCSVLFENNRKQKLKNSKLLDVLEEKCEQLELAQREINLHYERSKEKNQELESINKKLTSSIAEFYTLQQISKAIGSIFDIKELLKYVNDIILGVMGVNYSSIILWEEESNTLKLHTTNIKEPTQLMALTENINCHCLHEVIRSGKPVLENFADPDEYFYIKGREVSSLICTPLSTKTTTYGLVLIEHKHYNAFDEENLSLLDLIGQQVGIAMENARLYQQMQRLAMIDGLTGVYNRLYFHERLQLEFKNAEEGQYELSLAIFDVDHFKRFNDTYGHLFGDKVIRTIAEVAKNFLRSTDVLARFGGEEMVILFPQTSIDEAYKKVENLRQMIANTKVKDQLVTAGVTVSFGVSSYPRISSNENDLLGSADTALYIAKNSGRNCVVIAQKKTIEN